MEKEKGIIDAKKILKQFRESDVAKIRSIVYRNTNENLDAYYPRLGMEGKSVLSVGASGDQYINALLYKPKSIQLFDINPNTKYYIYLKCVAAAYLENEEFLDYFYRGKDLGFFRKKKFFDVRTYNKIRQYLPEDVRDFWDTLYVGFDDPNKIFIYEYKASSFVRPKYTQKDCYEEVRRILLDRELPKFKCFDIKDIDKHVAEDFDVIITSNICDYFDEDASWEDFLKEILLKKLRTGGRLQTGYNWYDEDGGYSFETPQRDRIVFKAASPCNKYDVDSTLIYKK